MFPDEDDLYGPGERMTSLPALPLCALHQCDAMLCLGLGLGSCPWHHKQSLSNFEPIDEPFPTSVFKRAPRLLAFVATAE